MLEYFQATWSVNNGINANEVGGKMITLKETELLCFTFQSDKPGLYYPDILKRYKIINGDVDHVTEQRMKRWPRVLL